LKPVHPVIQVICRREEKRYWVKKGKRRKEKGRPGSDGENILLPPLLKRGKICHLRFCEKNYNKKDQKKKMHYLFVKKGKERPFPSWGGGNSLDE